MADVSHELGSLRHIVDTSLSSKVAMFNKQATQHKENQLLNPFSGESGRSSPKPTFSKDEYGKPLAGSLTEARGQKANIHVIREMLELCQIIDSEGYEVKDEPTMRVIPFGELFNIYNYISDKVVGICLRARKYKLIEFEGEMLFQRRDDDVPIFLLKPIREIRKMLDNKTEEIKRGVSPAPQATSVLMDKRSRSASPNVVKIEPKKEKTAKVPEIKESTKEAEELDKTEEKKGNSITVTPAALPLIEVLNEKEETVTMEIKNTPAIDGNKKSVTIETEHKPVTDKVEVNISQISENPDVLVATTTATDEAAKEQSPTVEAFPIVTHEEGKPQPTILVEDENNKEVTDKDIKRFVSEEISSVIEIPNTNEVSDAQPELISASSSILEIIEDFVAGEGISDENNNISKKSNDNSDSV